MVFRSCTYKLRSAVSQSDCNCHDSEHCDQKSAWKMSVRWSVGGWHYLLCRSAVGTFLFTNIKLDLNLERDHCSTWVLGTCKVSAVALTFLVRVPWLHALFDGFWLSSLICEVKIGHLKLKGVLQGSMLFELTFAGMGFYVWHCSWVWWIFRRLCCVMCVKLDWNPAGGGIGGKWACLSWLCSRQSWGCDPLWCCDTQGLAAVLWRDAEKHQTFLIALPEMLHWRHSSPPLCRPLCYPEKGLHNNLQILALGLTRRLGSFFPSFFCTS